MPTHLASAVPLKWGWADGYCRKVKCYNDFSCAKRRKLRSSLSNCFRRHRNNKGSNNFDERPHHHHVIPCGGEWIRPTLTPSNAMVPLAHMSQPPNGISIGSLLAQLVRVSNYRLVSRGVVPSVFGDLIIIHFAAYEYHYCR